MSDKWTADDVAKIACNPVQCGLGPFPPIVDREVWLQAAMRVMKEIGKRRFLELVLENVDEALWSVVEGGEK